MSLDKSPPNLYPPNTPIEFFHPMRAEAIRHAAEMMASPQADGARGCQFVIHGYADAVKTVTDATFETRADRFTLVVRNAATKRVIYGEQFTRRGTKIIIEPISPLIAGLVTTEVAR